MTNENKERQGDENATVDSGSPDGKVTVEVTLSKTSIKKHTPDAVRPLRELLKNAGIIDYENDLEPGGRKEVDILFTHRGHHSDGQITFNRAKGRGDRRFWVKQFNGLAKAGDVVSFSIKDSKLHVTLMSKDKVDNHTNSSDEDAGGQEEEKNTEDFLVKLRKLQQDREDAISTPKSWAIPPLLEVQSKLDDKIDHLMRSTTDGIDGNGEWFFMVGSPGNGKSAYCGRYYRGLSRNYDFKFKRKGETELRHLEELMDDEIPYKIEVRKKGEKHSRCWMLQDASVLEDAYDNIAEPAIDLLKQMHAAEEKGVALIACTNRGVLETAYNFLKSEEEFQGDKWKTIDTIITKVSGVGREIKAIPVGAKNRKAPFKHVAINHESLDAESLLVGKDTFSRLIEKATAEDNWSECKKCPWSSKCPLVQNRDTLAVVNGKESLLKILKRAEALSGQVIVFRAAISLISYILSGCARDQANLSPCNWVHDQIKKKAYFNLLSRRVYMQLFCSDTPLALDRSVDIQKGQLDALKFIIKDGKSINKESKEAVEFALEKQGRLTTNVGLNNLLGAEGTLPSLDPINAPLNQQFLDQWGGNIKSLLTEDAPWVGGLEIECGSIFNQLMEALEDPTINNSVEHYRILKRWVSAFTIRLGGFKEAITRHDISLDNFLRALNLSSKEKKDTEDLQFIDKLNNKVQIAFRCNAEDGFIKLNGNFDIKSDTVVASLKARIIDNPNSIQLLIKVNEKEFHMSGNLFVWLMKITDEGLLELSLPEYTLDKLIDSRDRAAASINYATIDDIELRTANEEGKDISYKMKRSGDEVYMIV